MEISFERAAELVLLCGTWFLLLVATRRQLTYNICIVNFSRASPREKLIQDPHRLFCSTRDLMTATDAVSRRLGYQPGAGTEAGVIFEEVACDTLRLQLRC